MKYLNTFSRVVAMAAVTYGTLFASAALAAPQSVTYRGAPVAFAIPGKPFTIKFQVKNTSSDTFSGVKVTFHLPDAITTSAIAPDNSVVDGNDVSWSNVPLVPGQSFYPSFNLKV